MNSFEQVASKIAELESDLKCSSTTAGAALIFGILALCALIYVSCVISSLISRIEQKNADKRLKSNIAEALQEYFDEN